MKILIMVIMLMFSGASEDLGYKIYKADGPSMTPAIETGDRLTVDPAYYQDHPVIPGDIVIFDAPNGNEYVKRVVALPGDKVRMADNTLIVNNNPQFEPYIQEGIIRSNQEGRAFNGDFPETVVPGNSVFVLGDNRPNSMDSRTLGSIGMDKVKGKVIRIRSVD